MPASTTQPVESNTQQATPKQTSEWYEAIIESRYMPDFLLRRGVRWLLADRERSLQSKPKQQQSIRPLNLLSTATTTIHPFQNILPHTIMASKTPLEEQMEKKMKFIAELKREKIAVHTDKANEQHYEVPTEFIQLCLGKHMKYSCCLYPPEGENGSNALLDVAEERMLELYVERARLVDGQRVLELGCGWGSLCLYLAKRFPKSKITALSNSKTQKTFIDQQAKERGLKNLTVVTADVQLYQTSERYDRIVSIEMLEHMKNYPKLFKNISSWLEPSSGLFFCHVFSHRSMPYHFDTDEQNSWMARHFFTGGTMPSHDLFLYFQDHLTVRGHWFVNGNHYAKTSLDWLRNLDKNSERAVQVLEESLRNSPNHTHLTTAQQQKDEAMRMFQRWRIFYVAVEELFGWKDGEEWGVSHFLFSPKAAVVQSHPQ